MEIELNKIKDSLFYACIVGLYIIVIFFAYSYKMDPYLWFDEAGQFWISKGLNHDSDPLSPIGSIADVIRNNRDYNLDPGGFSVILHGWSCISNNYMWLRTLPFIFFILTILCWICLSYRWTRNLKVSILLGFVPILIPMLFNEAFELRAYSMEVLGCLVGCIAIDSLQRKITYSKLLLWSFFLSLFMTSRYSFIIVAFFISTYILYLIYQQQEEWRMKIIQMIIYSFPLFLTLGIVYLISMRYQNPNLNALSYLPYLNNNLKLLFRTESLWLFFILAIIAWATYINRKTELIKPYIGLIYVTLTTNLTFFVISFLGLHPWSAETTRCISMITLVYVSLSAITGILLKYTINEVKGCFFLIGIVGLLFLSLYRLDISESKERQNALTNYLQLNVDSVYVYVDRWESPCMRYQFEYGSLQGYATYPSHFTFEKYVSHRLDSLDNFPTLQEFYNTQPNLDEIEQFNILIVPELYKFKGGTPNLWNSVNNQNQVWIRK